MLRKKLIIQNLTELLGMNTGLTTAQMLHSILRANQYKEKDTYFADDTEVSSVIEKHLFEFKQAEDTVTDKEIETFLYKNSVK